MRYMIFAGMLLLTACGTGTAPEDSNDVPSENISENNVEENEAHNKNNDAENNEPVEENEADNAENNHEQKNQENSASNEEEAESGEENMIEELAFQLKADNQGDAIHVTLQLVNESAETKELTFTSGQRYDLIIRSDSGDELYNYAADMMFTQAIETVTLEADEEFVIEETWETEGEGPFTIEGEITASEVNGSEIAPGEIRETVTVE